MRSQQVDRTARCPRCGRTVVAVSASGAPPAHPDGPPSPPATVLLEPATGGDWDVGEGGARLLLAGRARDEPGWRSHHATCPPRRRR